jgi:hypothetical protein
MAALLALVISLLAGVVTVALLPLVLLTGVLAVLMTAVYGLIGVAVAIGFGLIAVFLRSLVVLWLAFLVGILAGLLGAGGAIVGLTGTAVWIVRRLRRNLADHRGHGPTPGWSRVKGSDAED